MTLGRFQKNVKVGFFILVFILYSSSIFFLGKTLNGSGKPSVKGIVSKVERETIENPLPYADIQRTQIIPANIKLCSNVTQGFNVVYPANWFTTYNLEDQKCHFFAPYSFVVPEFIDKQFTPIEVKVFEPESWLSTLKFYENPNDFYNVLSSQNLEINGKLVKKIEAKSTGNSNLASGLVATHYLVFNGEKPIRISYIQQDESDQVDNINHILNEFVQNLDFF